MTSTPTLVQTYKSASKSLQNGHGTRPVRVFQAGANGSRVHQMLLTLSDTAANVATLYHLTQMTLLSAMGTGAHVDGGAGSDTLTRSSGSYITDGWQVGDLLYVYGSTTLANDYAARVTAVAAGTLTFATGTVNTAENLPAGAILYKAAPIGAFATAALGGTSSGVAGVDLLSSTLFPDLDASPYRYRTLGANNGFAVGFSTLLASTEYADVITGAADY